MSAVTVPPVTPGLVSLDSIREAAAGLAGVAERTPLVHMPELSRQAGVPVHLKLENLQPTGAFKLRGAWTAVRRLSSEARSRGVITFSSGNHGQAVAYAAQRMGIRAVVVVPNTTPEAKRAGIRKWGGEIVVVGPTSEERKARALELSAEKGYTVIPPFDHPDVIAGQGTVALEILEQLPDVAHVAAPVGGGGLAAGITTALAAIRPSARMSAVEPAGAAGYAAAVAAGHPVRLERSASVADGLMPLSVGTLTFAHLYRRAEPVVVTDSAIIEATRWLHAALQQPIEPSGAATTAALRAGLLEPAGPLVLVVTGGNIEPDSIAKLTEA